MIFDVFSFSGRVRRSEFLITLAVVLVVSGLSHFLGPVVSGLVTFLAGLVTVAVSVRRLHDINASGWWVLAYFAPPLSVLLLLVLIAIEGTPCRNRFGADPKYQFGCFG